jgi:hypothetical protein
MNYSNPALLAALCTKYRTLRALRSEAQPAVNGVLRARLATLAAAFPGALRELDQLPLDVIDARLSAIERVADSGAEPADWMRLQIAYHGFMRAVLRIRRLSRARSLPMSDADQELAALAYTPAADEPPVSRFDLAALQTIRKPPGGRLNPWVIEQVARDCGVTTQAVHRALFLR